MVKSRVCLFVILLISTGITTASDDLSGRWKISYEVQGGDPGDQLADGSVASISKTESTLHGRLSLGNRSDGFLIGLFESGTFNAAATFCQKPTMFVILRGNHIGDNLRGSFTAYYKDGGFWMGDFTASRAGIGESYVNYTQDADLVPKPTIYLDPEAIWSAQLGKGKKDSFDINYSRNTVLMCRNKPMIWQWWL